MKTDPFSSYDVCFNCKNLHPEHFERTLGHKYFKLTNKKPILAEEFVKLAQKDIIEDFKQYLASSEEIEKHLVVYQQALSKYEAVLKTIALLSSLSSGKVFSG